MKTTVLPAVAIPFALALSMGCTGSARESDGGGAATTTGVTGSTTSTSSSTGSTGTGGPTLPESGPGVVDLCQSSNVDGPVFVIRKLSLGDTDPDGTPNKDAWKHYGFNIDGQLSTEQSQNLCKPAGDLGPKSIYPDGEGGIDNAFGRNILPMLIGYDPSFSANVNADIEEGRYNVLMWLTGLKADGDQPEFLSRVYGAPPQIAPPNFFGSDCFTVEPRDVTNPMDVKSARLSFPQSNLFGDHWYSGVGSRFFLTLSIAGYTLLLPIHQVRFAMDLDSAHETAQNGRIGGVLDVEELILAMKMFFAQIDASYCDALDTVIESEMRRLADILRDGTQDPQKTCDGISIGLGFEAVRAELGQVMLPGPLPKDPCAM